MAKFASRDSIQAGREGEGKRKRNHYGLNVCVPPPPQDSYVVEILMPNVMVFGGGAAGKETLRS